MRNLSRPALAAVLFLAAGCNPATPLLEVGPTELNIGLKRLGGSIQQFGATFRPTDGTCPSLDIQGDLNGTALAADQGGPHTVYGVTGYVAPSAQQECRSAGLSRGQTAPETDAAMAGQPLVLSVTDGSGEVRVRSDAAASFTASVVAAQWRAGDTFELALSRPVPHMSVYGLWMEDAYGSMNPLLSAEVRGDQVVAKFPALPPGTFKWELILVGAASVDECLGNLSCTPVGIEDTFRGQVVVK